MTYAISQVAEKYSLEPYTLRYYEKEGILSPNKSESGERRYTDGDLEQLEMVLCLKSTGMSLKEIKRYFDLCADGDATAGERLQIFISQRNHILEKMDSLQNNLAKIEHKIRWYREKYGLE